MARILVFGVIILVHGFVYMPSFGPGFIPLSRDPFYKKFRFDAVRISGIRPLHAHIDALRESPCSTRDMSLFCQSCTLTTSSSCCLCVLDLLTFEFSFSGNDVL
jgi:hypothetical protein